MRFCNVKGLHICKINTLYLILAFVYITGNKYLRILNCRRYYKCTYSAFVNCIKCDCINYNMYLVTIYILYINIFTNTLVNY